MTDGVPPFVSVVIPARNSERTIAECVDSVLRVEYPADRREIFVVDNRSTDRTARIASRRPVQLLREPRRGASSARNHGIRESRGEIVAFLDADCVATSGWLAELVNGFADPSVSAVAGEIVAYPPRTPAERYHAMRKARWQDEALHSSRPFVVTANVAFRRETFDEIGLFDPELLKGQDKDFGWRFFGHGLQLVYRPRALVFHRHRPTAWTLFTQHVGWGYGAALLHRKYGLPWSLDQELAKYRELAGTVAALGAAGIRYARLGGDRVELYQPFFEVLRRLGLRVGALGGLVAGRSGAISRGQNER